MATEHTELTRESDGLVLPLAGLQPAISVPAEAVAEFEGTPEARQVDDLEADRALLDDLMLSSYEGPKWERFRRVLSEYGFAVIRSWTRSGVAFRQCARKGFRGLPDITRTREDCEDIAIDTVVNAIIAFREKVLIVGKWDVTRGATLKTYFVGQCVLQYPNAYRRWMSESRDPLMVQRDPQGLAVDLRLVRTVAASAEDRAELVRALPTVDTGSPQHLELLVEAGYTAAEIAKTLGVSVRSVTSRLYRHRNPSQ